LKRDTEGRRTKGTHVRSSYAARLLTYLMVMGPGLIVMEADNDAGAVATYAQAGGQYGLHLLWVLLILLPVTYFIQEMVVRLGIATGRGHAAMPTASSRRSGYYIHCPVTVSTPEPEGRARCVSNHGRIKNMNVWLGDALAA
jgi:Mn2+/Fe2+ NRAMP family transporter